MISQKAEQRVAPPDAASVKNKERNVIMFNSERKNAVLVRGLRSENQSQCFRAAAKLCREIPLHNILGVTHDLLFLGPSMPPPRKSQCNGTQSVEQWALGRMQSAWWMGSAGLDFPEASQAQQL